MTTTLLPSLNSCLSNHEETMCFIQKWPPHWSHSPIHIPDILQWNILSGFLQNLISKLCQIITLASDKLHGRNLDVTNKSTTGGIFLSKCSCPSLRTTLQTQSISVMQSTSSNTVFYFTRAHNYIFMEFLLTHFQFLQFSLFVQYTCKLLKTN